MEKEIWKKPLRQCSVGGEALIEGVMMRNGNKIATAVRKSNGEIVVEITEHEPLAKRFFLFRLPVIRGAVNMIESMVIGMKALWILPRRWILRKRKSQGLKNSLRNIRR